MKRLNFKNPRAGKVKRAALHMRIARTIRRKRVAYARIGVAQAMKALKMEIARMQHLAKVYDVPIGAMDPLPKIPEMPGEAWIEWRQSLGDLAPVVKAPQAEARA